jgi:hypothetical protein
MNNYVELQCPEHENCQNNQIFLGYRNLSSASRFNDLQGLKFLNSLAWRDL